MSADNAPLIDPYGRHVGSLRVSVTQRCDLSCGHCHKEGQTPSREEMSPEEIARIVRVGASLGIRKVKLTGGEPLIREDINEVVRLISPFLREVSMTTNGTRLPELARPLKVAGLKRVNVSLHTLSPTRYASICGRDSLQRVLAGIHAAREAGLEPVKVNMVVMRSINEGEVDAMIDFCARSGAILQLIEYETDREGARCPSFAKRFFPLSAIEDRLRSMAASVEVNELHRRRRYRIQDNGTTAEVEVVRPMHNSEFCANCTRLRLSSDGLLKPCLMESAGDVDLLTPLRMGASDEDLKALFRKAVSNRRPYWG
ncbi:MAG: GTP 3',8-cyclase MoaA [Thermoplasmata archaeon]